MRSGEEHLWEAQNAHRRGANAHKPSPGSTIGSVESGYPSATHPGSLSSPVRLASISRMIIGRSQSDSISMGAGDRRPVYLCLYGHHVEWIGTGNSNDRYAESGPD